MLEIDNLSLILLVILLLLLGYYRLFSRPQPLVHPMLLGKQSEPSSVRRQGETGIYRSWATGQGTPLTVRPANALKTIRDVVNGPKITSPTAPRCILDTNLPDESLSEITRIIPSALSTLFPPKNTPSPILTLLPPSPSTALPLLLLQLSAPSSTPLIILPTPRLLTAALTSTDHPTPGVVVVHESLIEDVLEQVWEDCNDKVGVLVVGDPEKTRQEAVNAATGRGMKVHWWEDIWTVEKQTSFPDAQHNDTHSYFYSETSPTSAPAVVKVTHLNATAGIAGLLSLFPADKRPSPGHKDTIASSVRIDTPLGMNIALASLWSGSNFRLIGQPAPTWTPVEGNEAEELEALLRVRDQPKPTILFLSAKHHRTILDRLHGSFTSKPWASFIASHKLRDITSGFISRDSWVDRYLLHGLREKILGGIVGHGLRGVILVGDAPSDSTLAMSHLLLSLPLTRLHASPLSAGPVFVTHFYDLQTPSIPNPLKALDHLAKPRAHTGPPAANVEVLLKGDKVSNESGDQTPLEGSIWIRGPAVLERVDSGKNTVDGWTGLDATASVQTNGTFTIL